MKILVDTPLVKPLPVLVRPYRDELLSSWTTRVAAIYDAEPADLLAHIGLRVIGADKPPREIQLHRTLDLNLPLPAQRRIASALRTTATAIRRRTFPKSYGAVGDQDQLCPSRAPTICSRCSAAFKRAGVTGVMLRSWYCPWETECRRCGTIFGRPARGSDASIDGHDLPAVERDARRGSLMIWRYLERSWDGPFPPQTVVELLTLTVKAPSVSRRYRALYLLVPEATAARFPNKPGFRHGSPASRLVLLAGIARFNDAPALWIDRIVGHLAEQSEQQLLQIQSLLPAGTFPSPTNGVSWSRLGHSYLIAEHHLRLKLAANVRQIAQTCLELGVSTARVQPESHI